MNVAGKHHPPRPRRRSILWDGLNRGTAWLYAVIKASLLGRIFTGYREMDRRLLGGAHAAGRHRFVPMSPARLRVVALLERSWPFRLLRWIFHTLFTCPTAFYGMLGISYGLFSTLIYFIAPLIHDSLARERGYLIASVIIAVLSLPLVMTKKTLAGTLGSSALCRLIFIRFLGIPQDHLQVSTYKAEPIEFYLVGYVGLLAAVVGLFLPTLAIPLTLLVIGFVGMILAFPETGVVLFTFLLPAVWLNNRFLLAAELLILLTWLSYGVKLLYLHRTMRFFLLDKVMLALGVVILLSGITGAGGLTETLRLSVSLFICLSSYFLIVNLMNTRPYIRSCLLGVALSVGVVTGLAYLRLVPADGLSWLAGSRAGDAIVESFEIAMEKLSGLWVEHSELYLVLVFPWLYAFFLHTKRLFHKIIGVLFLALNLFLIVSTHSVSSLACVVCVTILFCLLLGHRSLSVGIVSLPLLGCGVYWLTYLYPVTEALRTILSRSRLYKSQLSDSLWQMVWDHPFGIGPGESAFASVYPAYAAPDLGAVSGPGNLFFEVLLGFGWLGLLVFVAALFFFLQKSLTSLGYAVVSKDRTMILGGVTSVVGLLVFGSVRDFITSPRVFFTVLLVVALCSAYEDILFEEHDAQAVAWAEMPNGTDRLYRRGDYNQDKE